MSTVTGFDRALRVAVASGKGGTGKTTLSVALALSNDRSTILLDCDVEEPNAALFLQQEAKAASQKQSIVSVPVPYVDNDICTGCGICKEACQYNAIIMLKKQVMFFHELCHSCGACMLHCPEKAIYEKEQSIGNLSEWTHDKLTFIQGEMSIGKAMSPPIIRAVKKRAEALTQQTKAELVITDCPPGTSCPMIAAVRDNDAAILVTEATPFGLNDLKLAVETMQKMEMPFGVVVNRCDVGDDRVQRYCSQEGISLLAEIPHDRKVAEAYSSGKSLLSAGTTYKKMMNDLHTAVRELAMTRKTV